MNTSSIDWSRDQWVRIWAIILLLVIIGWALLNGGFHFGESSGRTIGRGFTTEPAQQQSAGPTVR